jgi:hypothetical protein
MNRFNTRVISGLALLLLSTVLISAPVTAQVSVAPGPGATVSPSAPAPGAAPAAAPPAVATHIKSGSAVSVSAPGGTTIANPAPGTKITTTTSGGSSTTTTQQAPNGVEVEIGIVSRLNGTLNSYHSNNGTLSLSGLGRATPQLLTGLGFSCDTSTTTTTSADSTGAATISTSPNSDQGSFCKSAVRHLGAYASVQFGSGSTQTITGYSLGLTWAVHKNLRAIAGFSLSPSNEISPGFANAAAQYVSKNPALFPGVNPASLAANSFGAFDGIQVTTTPPPAGSVPGTAIYYPGAATATHYRGGFIVGITIPINVYNLLGGNNKSQ